MACWRPPLICDSDFDSDSRPDSESGSLSQAENSENEKDEPQGLQDVDKWLINTYLNHNPPLHVLR